MRIDNDDKIIKNALNKINTPKLDIKDSVIKRISGKKSTKSIGKVAAVLATACLAIVLSVPVMATTIPSFGEFIKKINSGFESELQPVGVIAEDNGIKVEVVAAMSDDEMTVAYINIKDMEGNRVDETIDLYDSYRVSGGSSFGSEVVNYDENSKTATIRIQSNGGKKLRGKEIKFSFSEFLSAKKDVNITLDKSILENGMKNTNGETITLDLMNMSGMGGELSPDYIDKGIINILKPNKENISLPNVDFMTISNIGLVDGRLHIQTKWSNGFEDYGFFYFTDNEGNKLNIKDLGVSFGLDEEGKSTYGHEYEEYIFDLSNVDTDNIKLNVDLKSYGNHVNGDWNTKFKIDPIKDKNEIDCSINIDGKIVNKVVISPLGVVLTGNKKAIEIENIKLNMIDGSNEVLSGSIAQTNKKKSNIRFLADGPLDLSKIESIDIGGNIIKNNTANK